MPTADALLAWARTQLGVTENPPGSNRVRYWDDVNMRALQGQPWCAAFYLAGLTAVGVKPVTRSVYVPQIIIQYRNVGRLFPAALGLPGDQVLYNIGDGHTGVLESVDVAAKTVTAIEGNTSSGNRGSQNNGGGVFRRTRKWGLVVGMGRPAFVLAPPAPAPSPSVPPVVTFPEDHMQRIAVQVPTLGDGTGFWDLDGAAGRPRVPFDKLAGQPFVNGGDGYPPSDKHHSVEPYEHGGNVRLRLWGFEAGAAPLVYVPVAS